MRQLHRVSQREVFVASGRYTYFYAGAATGTIEHWSLHEQPGGAFFFRADRDGRTSDGVSILIQALRAPEVGRLERLDMYLYTPQGEAKGYFAFFDDYVQIGRILGRGEREQEEMALPPGYVVNPQVMIAQCDLTAVAEGKFPLFLPEIEGTGSDLLKGRLEQWTVAELNTDEIEVAGQAYAARCYQIEDDSGRKSKFWYDRWGLLLRCEQPDGMVAELSAYARRREAS